MENDKRDTPFTYHFCYMLLPSLLLCPITKELIELAYKQVHRRSLLNMPLKHVICTFTPLRARHSSTKYVCVYNYVRMCVCMPCNCVYQDVCNQTVSTLCKFWMLLIYNYLSIIPLPVPNMILLYTNQI